jgi:hypothetical protein
MGAMMFRSRGVNHQVNWGNCYAEILRTKGGIPVSLLPIHPSRIPNSNIKRENGRLVYYVRRPDGGQPEPVAQEDMFHVPSIIRTMALWAKAWSRRRGKRSAGRWERRRAMLRGAEERRRATDGD